MNRKEIVLEALNFRPPPYVPWSWTPTHQCADRLREYLATDDLASFKGPEHTVDKDIGTPCDWPIKQPEDLAKYEWPNPDDDAWYTSIRQGTADHPDLFCVYAIGFSLY